MSELELASDLSIPLEAVTQTFAILAKRGSGKTYTALVLVEEMLKAGLQVVVIDPVGVCWGLRTSADGTEAGLPIIVLGGEHGDLAIDSTIGSAIADFVIQERQSVVLDLSDLSNNEMVRLITDFSERLYQKNRTPLHIVLDEADSFAPQKPLPGEQRMLGAIDKIVRRGRAKGIGVSLVSQRPAVINKNVLTQIEVLIALRTVSPQDRKAIENWIEIHGTVSQQEQLLNSLASLPIGTAWIWSPGWLNIFQYVKIRQRNTFDSSATPKIGSERLTPKVLAKVNLPLLKQRFAEITAQQELPNQMISRQASKQLARHNAMLTVDSIDSLSLKQYPDKNELERLKKLVTHLENQLATKLTPQPIFQDGELERLESAIHGLKEVGNQIVALAQDLTTTLSKVTVGVDQSITVKETNPQNLRTNQLKSNSQSLAVVHSVPFDNRKPIRNTSTAKGSKIALTTSQQRILDALVAFEALGLNEIHRNNVAVFSRQSPKSSRFTSNLSSLRSQGLIYYPMGGYVALTESGRMIGKPSTKIPALAQLHTAWYSKLSFSQARILQALVENYPNAIERDTLAKLAGQSPTSSAYTNNLGTLRSLRLIDYPRPKQVVATKLLFPLSTNGSIKASHLTQN